MDSPGDWTAAALFSPSKARAQQAQQRDWAAVDIWLAKQYGKRLPAFERNEDTLEALLALANVNEDADEQRLLVDKVGRQALQAHGRTSPEVDDVYQRLLDTLDHDGRQHLDILASLAVELGTAETAEMAQSICNLTAQRFELSEQVARCEAQQAALQRELQKTKAVLQILRNEAFQPPSDLSEQTAEMARSTKQLRTKLVEYDERTSPLRSSSIIGPSLEDVLKQAASSEAQQARLSALENELCAYEGLPPDPKAAKGKLEVARSQLPERDERFEELADAT
ncbi:hypothetical protein LTS14_002727 [Recurvomyces mirabilis]|uniref:uncharacterized protein n=1 Tax=Recurvomyces mirabilis TaxID=574656 RepID=UPI002DDFB78B|nr:hypothetical protein LTS14_002727 [Recurvomyces mirabilis]